jgi:hypothetical protein
VARFFCGLWRLAGPRIGYLQNMTVLLEIVLNCNEQPPVLMKWTGNANHWLTVDTVGTRSNRDGIGAQVKHHGGEDGKDAVRIGD